MKRFKWLVVTIMLSLAASAFAQTGQTVEDRKNIMDAQIELLNKQAALNAALRSVAGSSAIGLPSVVSISRVGERRIARLQMPNGVAEYYREGDMIRQGLTVTTITSKQVIVAVANGKKQVAVPLDFVAVSTAAPGMPPAPPGQGGGVPNELLPSAPDVTVPAIAVIPHVAAPATSAAPSPAPSKAAQVAASIPVPPKGK